MDTEISLIDFTSYISGDSNSKLNVSKALVKSIRASGFVFLKNFGIKRDEISEIFELAEEFFQSPIQLKQSVKKSHKTFCGFDKIESEKGSINREADYKESFMVNQIGTPWPNQNTLFKEKMLSFHKKCFDFCMDVCSSILLGLGVDSKSLSDQFSKGECAMLRFVRCLNTSLLCLNFSLILKATSLSANA
jgi:isopenicillin N synthase-like dioxygenase